MSRQTRIKNVIAVVTAISILLFVALFICVNQAATITDRQCYAVIEEYYGIHLSHENAKIVKKERILSIDPVDIICFTIDDDIQKSLLAHGLLTQQGDETLINQLQYFKPIDKGVFQNVVNNIPSVLYIASTTANYVDVLILDTASHTLYYLSRSPQWTGMKKGQWVVVDKTVAEIVRGDVSDTSEGWQLAVGLGVGINWVHEGNSFTRIMLIRDKGVLIPEEERVWKYEK